MEKTCLASRSLYFWTFDNFSLIRNTKSMGSPCRIWGEDKTTCEALLQEATETEEAYWGKGPLCRSASQHLRRSGERLCVQFSRCVDLEPEDRADEQKGRHWNKGGVITAEAVDEVPVCHSREQTSHLGRCVHQPDHRSRMPSSDIQANAENARLLEGNPPIDEREQDECD